MKPDIKFFILIVILIASKLSSFAETASILPRDKKSSGVSDSSLISNEDSREKRSDENIMFGNQQNKPNLVSDGMDDSDENLENKTIATESETEDDNQKLEDVLKDDSIPNNDKRNLPLKTSSEEMDSDSSGMADWYNNNNNVPVLPDTMQYLLNTSPQQPIHDVNALYDQEELYRRKRQPQSIVALRKRSLRSPLGQMIQTRGRRLPRRSMRFKRQVVDMQDLISLLNKASPNNEGKYFDQTTPGSFNAYSESSSFRHPYDMIRQSKKYDATDFPNYMSDIDDNEGNNDEEFVGYSQSSLPFGSRYFELEDFHAPDIKSVPDEDEQDGHQSWMEPEILMASNRKPSIFSVSRRSVPLFYPIDYRFIPGPGFKKRSSFSGQRHNDEQENEFGKWGRIVNVPEAYASAEDVARLYDLANLLAERESPELRNRRSA